ncbi:uncharacterized protein B0P05DRAFT_531336 [Gilbertella persicaria]|uniref:uncharacterized protein n=1 Tax=Gilbertella persicaria TaxID=101096 RepID=UPI00222085D7|nr:uncharacterized protein B0P05DRAFT_531336 [Gilbertella persicaria]KAI8088066.1 hypothetical protein B0P05DRAFT_531336 [Gilbertella persicaria]
MTQREQMSISSITCDTIPSHKYTPIQYPYHRMTHSQSYPGTCMIPSSSSSLSADEQFYIHSPPSSPHSTSSVPHCLEKDDPSLHERRQRNKAASAKYRQKKNMQQHEMRTMIQQLSERNAVLERQLREMREENHKLRATTDKLRGKCVAKKMLRQWIERQKASKPMSQHDIGVDILDDDLDSLCSDF